MLPVNENPTSSNVPALAAFWPVFLLSEQMPVTDAVTLLDQLCPPALIEMRALYSTVFARVCPAAAEGIDVTSDSVLQFWQRIIRADQLTGELGEVTWLPEWAYIQSGSPTKRHGVTGLLKLPWYKRVDEFMDAMQRAAKGLN